MEARPPLGSPAPLLGESVTPNASKMLRCLATVLCAILLAGLCMSKASKTEGRALLPCQVDVEAVTDLSSRGPAQVLLFASSFDSCVNIVSSEVYPSHIWDDHCCSPCVHASHPRALRVHAAVSCFLPFSTRMTGLKMAVLSRDESYSNEGELQGSRV